MSTYEVESSDLSMRQTGNENLFESKMADSIGYYKRSDASFILREITKTPTSAVHIASGESLSLTCSIDTVESLTEVFAIWSLADPLDAGTLGFDQLDSASEAHYTLEVADAAAGAYYCTLLFPDGPSPTATFYVVG